MSAKDEMKAQANLYLQTPSIDSGSIWVCPKGLDETVPENWEKLEGVEDVGYTTHGSLTDECADTPVPIKTEYSANMRMYEVSGRGWGKTARQQQMAEEWMGQHGMKLQDWQRPYVADILGRFEYTPADELRDRLNARLRGNEPGLPVNWRGL